MTALNVSGDGEAVAFWSAEMYRVVGGLSRRFSAWSGLEHEDLRQECFLALAARAAKGETRLPINILVKACKFHMGKVLDRARRKKRSLKAMREDCEPAAREGVDRDAVLDVRAAFDAMPAQGRILLFERFARDRTIAEIAQERGEGVAGLRIKQRAAYTAARNLLAGGYGQAVPRRLHASFAERERWRRARQGKGVDWTKWGPIPNQREDD